MNDDRYAFAGTILGAILGATFPLLMSFILEGAADLVADSRLSFWGEAVRTGIWVFVPIGAFLGCVSSGLHRIE